MDDDRVKCEIDHDGTNSTWSAVTSGSSTVLAYGIGGRIYAADGSGEIELPWEVSPGVKLERMTDEDYAALGEEPPS